MMGQKMDTPCGDCDNGRCTMNCGPKIPPEVRSAYLRSIGNVEMKPTMTKINQGFTSWDDLENELRFIRDALDDADSTKFGEMGRLLDTMAKRADRALRYAEVLRQRDAHD